jgi:hypothetical protein
MRRFISCAALAAMVCLSTAALHVGKVFAQGAASSSLTLTDTKIASRGDNLVLTTTAATAYPLLTLNCPGAVTACTIRTEFSAEISKVSNTTAAQAEITINGMAAKILPATELTMSAGMGNGVFLSTFTVWRANLPPAASYTVRVKFKLAANPAQPGTEQGVAGPRTLTVQMFTQ